MKTAKRSPRSCILQRLEHREIGYDVEQASHRSRMIIPRIATMAQNNKARVPRQNSAWMKAIEKGQTVNVFRLRYDCALIIMLMAKANGDSDTGGITDGIAGPFGMHRINGDDDAEKSCNNGTITF